MLVTAASPIRPPLSSSANRLLGQPAIRASPRCARAWPGCSSSTARKLSRAASHAQRLMKAKPRPTWDANAYSCPYKVVAARVVELAVELVQRLVDVALPEPGAAEQPV